MTWRKFLNRFASRKCQIDDTTRFERMGRDLYRYIEGDRVLWVGVEGLWGKPEYVIFASAIEKWQPPHDEEEMSAADKERIIKNVRTFFDKQGITYKIV